MLPLGQNRLHVPQPCALQTLQTLRSRASETKSGWCCVRSADLSARKVHTLSFNIFASSWVSLLTFRLIQSTTSSARSEFCAWSLGEKMKRCHSLIGCRRPCSTEPSPHCLSSGISSRGNFSTGVYVRFPSVCHVFRQLKLFPFCCGRGCIFEFGCSVLVSGNGKGGQPHVIYPGHYWARKQENCDLKKHVAFHLDLLTKPDVCAFLRNVCWPCCQVVVVASRFQMDVQPTLRELRPNAARGGDGPHPGRSHLRRGAVAERASVRRAAAPPAVPRRMRVSTSCITHLNTTGGLRFGQLTESSVLVQLAICRPTSFH